MEGLSSRLASQSDLLRREVTTFINHLRAA
jgi:hypothetical protein